MKASEFGSKQLLKAVDLGKKPVKTTITNVVALTLEGEKKLAIEVADMEQQIVLNATRRVALVGAYGDETDNWIGKPCVIIQGTTEFKGRMVVTIEIQVPGKHRTKAPADAPTEDDGYSGQFDS